MIIKKDKKKVGESKERGKKSVVFSLSALLLALSLYSLFMAIDSYTFFMEKQANDIYAYSALSSYYSSFEHALNKLIRLYGFNFEIERGNILNLTITQELPTTNLENRLNEFSNFINLNTKFNLTYSSTTIALPNSMTYTNPTQLSILIDNIGNSSGLDVIANVSFTFTSCFWLAQSPGTFPVSVEVYGTSNSYCFDTANIDPNGLNIFATVWFIIPTQVLVISNNQLSEVVLTSTTYTNKIIGINETKIRFIGMNINYSQATFNLSLSPIIYGR